MRLRLEWALAQGAIDSILTPARIGNNMSKSAWDFDESLAFFVTEFCVPDCFEQADLDEPESEGEEFVASGQGWLRRGVYQGVMMDCKGIQRKMSLRISFQRDDCDKVPATHRASIRAIVGDEETQAESCER